MFVKEYKVPQRDFIDRNSRGNSIKLITESISLIDKLANKYIKLVDFKNLIASEN